MRKITAVFGLALFLLTLSAAAFGGTIHVPEDAMEFVYGENAGMPQLGIGISSTHPLDNWHLINPLPEMGDFMGITLGKDADGNTINIALVNSGGAKIMTSPDGLDWYTKKTFPGTTPYSILYTKNVFVAVGKALIAVSTDGAENWTQYYSGGADDIWDVTYGEGPSIPGGGKFVAVGLTGKIMTTGSTPGLWTQMLATTSATLKGVVFGSGKFVAVGLGGAVLTSADGESWPVAATQGLPTSSNNLNSIAFGNDRFVTITDTTIFASTDGITWQKVFTAFANKLYKVIYLNNQFIAFGNYGTVLSSPNGLTWTMNSPADATAPDIKGMAIGSDNTTYIAVGKGVIMTSPDLISWDKWILQTKLNLSGLAYGNKKFISAGDSSLILTSPDADIWTTRTYQNTAYPFKGITFGNNKFVAVGGSTTEDLIISSADGALWSETAIASCLDDNPANCAKTLYGVAFGGATEKEKFVAVGLGGHVLTSPDGDNWTATNIDMVCVANPDCTTKFKYTLNGVAYGANKFIAVGNTLQDSVTKEFLGGFFYSSNGVDWTIPTSPFSSATDILQGVAFGKGTFVAVGKAGKIFYSPDGLTWSPADSGITTALYSVTWNQSFFVAVGDDLTILTSPDGITWTKRISDATFLGTLNDLRAVAYGNNTFVAVGNTGLILRSDPIVPPAPTNIRAVSLTANKIGLSWDIKTNEKSFKIYRKKGTAAATLINTTDSNVSGYTDANATGNNAAPNSYSYYLKACNDLRCSPSSKTALVPFPPASLTGTIAAGKVNLAWTDASNETGYEVYRKTGTCTGTSWTLIGTTAANVKAFSNTGLGSGKTYSYKVRSYTKTAAPSAYGYSMYTNCVTKTTP